MAKPIIGGALAPQHPASECAQPSASTVEQELLIDARPDDWVEYEGTAAQLQSEGLIPRDLDWPIDKESRRWSANGFDYWLRRTRPRGHKGSMRSWLQMDNWFIRVTVTGRTAAWKAQRRIERKAAELHEDIHRQTTAGRREWDAKWNRYWASRDDKAFQAFKGIFLPEKTKPGRKPKGSAAKSTEGSAA